MKTQDRLDLVARSLARPDRAMRLGAVASRTDTAVDGVSRALARGVTRRQAVRLAAAAGVTSYIGLKTDRARGQSLLPCPPRDRPTFTQPCGESECCQPGWECCAPVVPNGGRNCCDTAGGYECGKTASGPRNRTQCVCKAANECNGSCCGRTQYCETYKGTFFDTRTCVDKCPNPRDRRCQAGHCCSATQTCCDSGCCAPPLECASGGGCKCPNDGKLCGTTTCCAPGLDCGKKPGTCVTPPKTPGMLDGLFDGFTGYGSAVKGAAGSRGNRRRLFARAAAAPAAVEPALLELAAVDSQLGAAIASFADGHLDKAYKRAVATPAASLPPLAAGPGLDAGGAAALNALIAAEAKAFGLLLAAATAAARARGALSAKDQRRAKVQVLSAARFAGQAADALRPLPGLRSNAVAALQAGGTAEVVTDYDDVVAFRGDVEDLGVPADLKALLARLGVTGPDLDRARRGLALASSSGGPSLIAPLADATLASTLTSLADALAAYAKTARRSPLRTSRGAPAKSKRLKGTS